MYNFSFVSPESLAEAESVLAAESESQLFAGGMTLLPSMKVRLAAPDTLIDLSKLSDLRGIYKTNDHLEIGAMTRHFDVETNLMVKQTIPALSNLASNIADRQVRYRGTIGGALSNADPAADYPAAALALEAKFITNHREITVEDFFVDMFTTSLGREEILCSIKFKIPISAAYVKIPHSASGYAMAGAFVAKFDDGYQVGITGAASMYFRHHAMESALNAGADAEACYSIAATRSDYMSDTYAPAIYRENLVRVAASDAVRNLSEARQPKKRHKT